MKRADCDRLTVLQAIDEHGQLTGYFKLCEQFPTKVVDAAFDREVSARTIDYGVSLRSAWIEPKGRLLLDRALTPEGGKP